MTLSVDKAPSRWRRGSSFPEWPGSPCLVLWRHAVEAAHPFLEPAVIGVDVVDMGVGGLGAGLARRGNDMTGIFALWAKATIAFPPSQTNRLAGVTTPSSAAAIEARSTLGNTASVVAPSRSRATDRNVFARKQRRVREAPKPDATSSSASSALQSAFTACRRCAGVNLPIPPSQSSNSGLSTNASSKSDAPRIARNQY